MAPSTHRRKVMITRHSMFNKCKAVFATHLNDVEVPAGHVLFNASRPIFGNPLAYDEWCFGRFYTTLAPDDDHAEYSIKQNIELDARIVSFVKPVQAARIAPGSNRFAVNYHNT